MDERTQELLLKDPGAPEFVGAAESLRLEGIHQEALIVLLKGLSHSPTNHQGRLLLARVFYEYDCVPFAIRELEHLCSELPQNSSIRKLYHSIAGKAFVNNPLAGAAAAVMAESEIDFEGIEELEKDSF